MKHYKTLKEAYSEHPRRLDIRNKVCINLKVSEPTFYRLLHDGSIIGRLGVLDLLFEEFHINYESKKGYSLNFAAIHGLVDAPQNFETI